MLCAQNIITSKYSSFQKETMNKVGKYVVRISPNANHLLTFKISRTFYIHKVFKSASSSSSSSDGSSSSSDDSKQSPDLKNKNEERMKKLNALLMMIIQQDKVSGESKLNLAQPKNRRLLTKNEKITMPDNEEVKLATAAKSAADSIGGDVQQTESDLLMKLLNTKEVHQEDAATTKNLSDIIKGMRIDRETKTPEQSRADQIRQIIHGVQNKIREEAKPERKMRRLAKLPRKQESVYHKIDLFGSTPLDIFTNKVQLKEVSANRTWNTLYKRDLKLAVTHPPSNYFQQMILWTEQGKLWKFPIDNEQGIEEERNIYFAQHVFLEEHLEPWCPTKGPIRHFMELVCVGLSKNPYLTVEAKKEHIEWYKNYFEEKKALLQEVGALPLHKSISHGDTKTTDK